MSYHDSIIDAIEEFVERVREGIFEVIERPLTLVTEDSRFVKVERAGLDPGGVVLYRPVHEDQS